MATSAFYSSDHVLDHFDEKDKEETLKFESFSEVCSFFEVDRCIKWIQENGFKRTALQMPDLFLNTAFDIALYLEKETSARIYLLADTSYRNCCVDDIAAEHAKCDSLIHFGEACLSAPSSRIPILYVFGQQPIDLDHFSATLNSQLQDEEIKKYNEFVFLYEANIASCSTNMSLMCRSLLSPDSRLYEATVLEEPSGENLVHGVHLGRKISMDIEKAKNPVLIFVGAANSPLLTLWLMTYVKFETILSYCPQSKNMCKIRSSSHQKLKKRLFLIEKVRDANTIGLVVAATGVKGFQDAIARVRQLCTNSHKRLYVLSIGKINEAKLSNFASDIDVFVLLSCPFGIVLDSSDFYKPVVSLFEAEIALNPDKTWYTGDGWTSEFGDFINDTIGECKDDEVDMSLISGKIRATTIENGETSDKNKQVIEYTAGDYFNNRSWKGLDDDQSIEADLSLQPGRKGIPISYDYQS